MNTIGDKIVQQDSKDMLDHSVSPALYMTTSFTKRCDDHPERTHYSYSRTQNPNFEILQKMIRELYGTGSCYLYPSGMSAISTLFDYYACDNGVFIVGDEMYGDTFRTLQYLEKKYDNFRVVIIDIKETESIIKLVEEYKDTLKLIFFESCTNPSGHMLDYSVLKTIKKIVPSCPVAIDNSWLSGALFNPYRLGADLVIESISKYIGGGRVIMGLITGSKKMMRGIIDHSCIFGLRASQYDCWITADMLTTLHLRMNHASNLTLEVARFLETHEKVSRVMYPLLESHPTYEHAKQVLDNQGGPAIIWFHIPLDKKSAKSWCNSGKIIKYATSYGKSHTLLDPYPWEEGSGFYDGYSNNDKESKFGTWVRMAIGYGCTLDSLLKELNSMLKTINN